MIVFKAYRHMSTTMLSRTDWYPVILKEHLDNQSIVVQWYTAAGKYKWFLLASTDFARQVLHKTIWVISFRLIIFLENIWDKIFKIRPNKLCRRQPLKKLKWYDLF